MVPPPPSPCHVRRPRTFERHRRGRHSWTRCSPSSGARSKSVGVTRIPWLEQSAPRYDPSRTLRACNPVCSGGAHRFDSSVSILCLPNKPTFNVRTNGSHLTRGVCGIKNVLGPHRLQIPPMPDSSGRDLACSIGRRTYYDVWIANAYFSMLHIRAPQGRILDQPSRCPQEAGELLESVCHPSVCLHRRPSQQLGDRDCGHCVRVRCQPT